FVLFSCQYISVRALLSFPTRRSSDLAFTPVEVSVYFLGYSKVYSCFKLTIFICPKLDFYFVPVLIFSFFFYLHGTLLTMGIRYSLDWLLYSGNGQKI